MATPVTLASGRSAFYPPSFAVDQGGNLFIANGLDKLQRWNGTEATTVNAGIVAPAAGPTVTTPVGGAATAGDYVLYYRFKDIDGNYSSLSPVTTVTAAANDQFSWDTIPASAEARVTHKELLRSTSDQTTVLYLIATITNATTSYTSDTASDATIQAGTAYPILNADGTTNLNRFGVPITKATISSFYDRFFGIGEVVYDEGSVELTNGSASVTGRGTAWTSTMVGRKFYVQGQTTEYEVSAVGSATSITLTANYAGSTSLFGKYAIRDARTERNTIYYTPALEPESWRPTDYARIQERNDNLIGAMPLQSYLFALARHHIYRLTLASQGACLCLNIQLASERGCCSPRAWATVEGIAYLLDERGIHKFDGNGSQHVSTPIQNYWREKRINFRAAKWFHASIDPVRELIRFHVALGGAYLPNASICYLYRSGQFWVEEYNWQCGGSCLAQMASQTVPLLGGQYGKFYFQQGTLDGLSVGKTIRGTPTAASALQITDTSSDAEIPDSVVGAPLAIVSGPGKHQVRTIVASASGTITVDRPFFPVPTTDSEYQIGGVLWNARLGTHQIVSTPSGQDTQRDWELYAKPTTYAASVDVRRYVDNAATPENYGFGAGTAREQGVVTSDGSPDAVASLKLTQDFGSNSGYRSHRFDARTGDRNQSGRYLSLELRGVQGTDPVEIREISVEGVE